MRRGRTETWRQWQWAAHCSGSTSPNCCIFHGCGSSVLLVISSHPLHGARDLLGIVPLQRNAQQMAIFETAAKGWWVWSTIAKGLGSQSCTDCLKASLPTDRTELVHCTARPFVAANISFSGENVLWFLWRSVALRAARRSRPSMCCGEKEGWGTTEAKGSTARGSRSALAGEMLSLALECRGDKNSLWGARAAGMGRKQCYFCLFTTKSLFSKYSPPTNPSEREKEATSHGLIYPNCICRTRLEQLLHSRANWTRCISPSGSRDGSGWVQGGGSRALEPRAGVTAVPTSCRSVPSWAALIDSLGRGRGHSQEGLQHHTSHLC